MSMTIVTINSTMMELNEAMEQVNQKDEHAGVYYVSHSETPAAYSTALVLYPPCDILPSLCQPIYVFRLSPFPHLVPKTSSLLTNHYPIFKRDLISSSPGSAHPPPHAPSPCIYSPLALQEHPNPSFPSFSSSAVSR